MNKVKSFKKFIMLKEDNKGSVFITVLVAFLFVSVLVAIILSTVSVNFQMRAMDRQTKDEFYYAEKTLNDLYTGIGQDCSKIMGEEYNKVLSAYRKADAGTVTYKDEEKAYKAFTEAFVKRFISDIKTSQIQKFSGYVVKDTHKKGDNSDKTSRAIIKNPGTIKFYSDYERNTEITSPETEAEKVQIIVIKDVKIQSNPTAEENIGYISEINTDIVIEVPKVSFFTMNNRLFDYAILANDGIEFGENSIGKIKGNVYGGTISYSNIKDEVNTYEYGGIYLKNGAEVSIDDAAYVVSGGDIYLDGGTLNINQSNTMLNNQIWFENMDINGNSTVKINGDLFAADDLQVNDGSEGSNVIIKGSYYGYNDGNQKMTPEGGGTTHTLYTKKSIITSKNTYEKSDSDGKNSASRSSSIIMNSKDAVIDMQNLKTLMLLGNAYINHESKNNIIPGAWIDSGKSVPLSIEAGKISDASMPDSVALKASQNIMLMPTQFLTSTNPKTCEDGSDDPFKDDKDALVSKMTAENWFGKDYIDLSKPYTVIKMKSKTASNVTHTYAYCYLNFKDDEAKAAYVKKIQEGGETGCEPTAKTIKKELLEMAKTYDGQILLGGSRVYATAAVLGYDGSDINIIDSTAEKNTFAQYSANLYKRYRMLDTYLDPMTDVSLSAVDNKSIHIDDFQKEDNEMPTGRFFWLWGLRKGATSAAGSYASKEISASSKADEFEAYGSNFIFLQSSGPSGTVDLCSALGGTETHKAFVIVDGNAVVNSNLSINGFLVVKGKLTVADNKTLKVTYDSTLFNKRIEKEQLAVSKNEGYHDEKDPSSNDEMKNLLIYYMMNGSRNLYTSGSTYKMPKRVSNINNNDMKANQDNDGATSYREYKFKNGQTDAVVDDINTDYTSFVYFENWKKGQR